jgi:RNA polymerase sigma factor (sigma-70 family)
MTMGQLHRVIEHLQRVTGQDDAAGLSDGQLVDRFLAEHDEAAFESLVRRHGTMVLGVCRRVIGNAHDAEDAFQATFLVLARKAASVRPRELVGNWLYGVAYRTALKARAAAARRHAKERPMTELSHLAVLPDELWHDLRPLLDQELHRLPDQARALVVLCDLEGKPRKEVASRLGLPEGTLSSRLARAHEKLARRLTQRGVALSAGAVAAALSQQAVLAALPAPLVGPLVKAAALVAAGTPTAAGLVAAPVAALTEGVLHAMFLTKLKTAALWLVTLSLLGGGAAVATHQALADKPEPKPVADKSKPPADKEKPPADKQKPPADKEKPKPEKGEAGASVAGIIRAVDAGKRTITLSVAEKGAKRGDKTYELDKDVKVLLSEGLTKNQEPKVGKLADVAAGASASLRLAEDGKTVIEVRPRGLVIQGGVKAVDAAKGTITVAFKSKDGPEEKTCDVGKDVKVLLNDGLIKSTPDMEGKLADLTEGATVVIQMSVLDPSKALYVRVQGATVGGSVKAVDAANDSITINVKADGGHVEKKFTVAKEARIGGKKDAVKLGDLTEGTPVALRLSVFDTSKVVAIQVFEKGDNPKKKVEE